MGDVGLETGINLRSTKIVQISQRRQKSFLTPPVHKVAATLRLKGISMSRLFILVLALGSAAGLSACSVGETIDGDSAQGYVTITHTQRGTLYWEE